MLPLRHGDSYRSKGFVGRTLEKVKGWFRLIMQDKNSRNLLGFLSINLTFAFVELFYGIVTNSLGLISDACHMFFDCTGLLFGLVRLQKKYTSQEKEIMNSNIYRWLQSSQGGEPPQNTAMAMFVQRFSQAS